MYNLQKKVAGGCYYKYSHKLEIGVIFLSQLSLVSLVGVFQYLMYATQVAIQQQIAVLLFRVVSLSADRHIRLYTPLPETAHTIP